MDRVQAVTGAFGFSGKHIARRLLDAGKTVVTLTASPNRPDPFDGRVKARPYRFDDVAAMAEQLRDVEVLYNTYWVRFNHGTFTQSDAVTNTRVLFEAARMAGVRRIVHVSITNAREGSPFEYFHSKGYLERSLRETGVSHAILRPAVLFGPGDILINNIAWTLRYSPVFAVFGDGQYHLQPIHVDDLAKLAVEQGEGRDNTLVNAVGAEDFTYLELVRAMRRLLGVWRPIVHVPPSLGYYASVLLGKLVGDVFVTRPEIEGLMADTLHAPGAQPYGDIRLSEWISDHKKTLGKKYASELARRLDRTKAY